MKIILTFTLLMIPGVVSSISVTGYSGGEVTITCKYDKRYTENEKYFCKGQCTTKYSDLIKTDVKDKWVHYGRFSLYDDTRSTVFTVTIRDLREEDSGTYHCGTDISLGGDSYTKVNLKVMTDDCCVKSISLSAAAGGSVNISCKYPQSHISDVKFLCWRSGADLCAEETSVKKSRRWSPERKIQLYDDREKKILMGRISHVTEQHSEYWCGVQSDQGHKSFITRVLIDVTETLPPPPSSSSSRTSSPTSSSSLSSSSPPASSSSRTSSSSSSSPPASSSSSRTSLSSSSASSFSSDKSSLFTGSSLIVPLVLVLVVLIIAGLLLLFLCKKHQSRAGGDSSSQTGPGKHEVVSYTGCDYEEIKDTHKELPTNPSNSSDIVYATAQLPTNPSDSSDTVYATAQLPTNPPVSSNCVYATVQKASGDSQRCITSAEDLNYAVVNFHKESDCPDSVSIRNNQDYSEYTAVNHLTA